MSLNLAEEIKGIALNESRRIQWLKVIGIGDKAVGKTSIVKSFCESKFSNVYHETVGVDYGFKLQPYDDHKLRLSFWDFGGDSAYRLVRKELYGNTDICLLIYDVTDNASVEGLDFWLQELSSSTVKMPKMVVVGNKCDQGAKEVNKNKTPEAWARMHGFSSLHCISYDWTRDTGDVSRHFINVFEIN